MRVAVGFVFAALPAGCGRNHDLWFAAGDDAGSPAIGKGVALPDVKGTFDGECPPTPPNLGAY